MEETTALGGMTSIREFCRSINLQCSESTIISLIKECDFPARKLRGQWTSDKVLIKKWHVGFVSGNNGQTEDKSQKVTTKSSDKTIKRVKRR